MNIESQKYEVRSQKSSYFKLRTSDFVLLTFLALTLMYVAPLGDQGTKADSPPKASDKMITLSG